MTKPINPIVLVLIQRDGMDKYDAEDMLEEARREVAAGADPEEVLYNDFGLELDYIFNLLEGM